MSGTEMKLPRFLSRIPVFFADQDSVRTQPGDQYGFVIRGRFVKQAIKLRAASRLAFNGESLARPELCKDGLRLQPRMSLARQFTTPAN
jgi:hypothetical protein